MRLNIFFSITLIIPAMILSYTDYLKEKQPHKLEGTVTDARTGTPVANVHLYVVQGTEEILTNGKGEFKLATWQKLPLSLTVSHIDYNTEVIKITDSTETLNIKIRKK